MKKLMKKKMKNSNKFTKKRGLATFKMATFFLFFILALKRGKYLLALISFLGLTISGLDLVKLSPALTNLSEWANILYVPFCLIYYVIAYLLELAFPKHFKLL